MYEMEDLFNFTAPLLVAYHVTSAVRLKAAIFE
jgi:hypothetical protein